MMTDPSPKEKVELPGKASQAPAKAADDEVEAADVYTAEFTCKCGRKIAANAWFCPQCGRPYLVNMLFALIVLAMGFSLLNQLVLYVFSLFSRQGGATPGR